MLFTAWFFFFALFAIIRPCKSCYTCAVKYGLYNVQREQFSSFRQHLMTKEAYGWYTRIFIFWKITYLAAILYKRCFSVPVDHLYNGLVVIPALVVTIRCGFLGAFNQKEIRHESGLIDFFFCQTGYTRNYNMYKHKMCSNVVKLNLLLSHP